MCLCLVFQGFEAQVKNLETATFDSEGQELYRHIVTKHAWLKHKESGGMDDCFLCVVFTS